MKIVIVCERLHGRGDEGIKNLTIALLHHLEKRHEVIAFTKTHHGHVVAGAVSVRMNKYFLNQDLVRRVRGFGPNVVLYVPWTSGTPRTFLRGRVLRVAARAPLAIYLTQHYEASLVERLFMRFLLPDYILAQSNSMLAAVERLGCVGSFVPSGVDLGKFQILSEDERHQQRCNLGIQKNDTLVLHIGHLNRHRFDVAEILELAKIPEFRLVMVGSTDTLQDQEIVWELKNSGIIVIQDFIPEIQKLVGAADVYLFPTREARSSVAVPLSVLEALACGIPVVCTPFQGIPRLFPDSPYVRFVKSLSEMKEALHRVCRAPEAGARALVEDLSWDRIGLQVEQLLSTMCGPAD